MICIITGDGSYGTITALKSVPSVMIPLLQKESCPVDHNLLSRILALPGIVFLLCAAASCTPHRVPAEAAAPFHPARIASGVPSRPGSMSWSPDGKQIAFISSALNIYDREQRTLRTVGIKNPSYLLWTAEQGLLVIARGADTAVLCVVEPGTLAVTQHILGPDARALYHVDRDRLLVLSMKRTLLRFGIETQYRLSAYHQRGAMQNKLYSFEKIYPRRIPDELLFTMLHAALDPLNDALLVMELVTPPVVSAYTRLKSIDVLTGEAREIAAPQNTVYTGISWSPDGRRLALSDASGRLEITDLRVSAGAVRTDAVGLHPAWNPRGSLIYLGGYLVSSNGKTEAALLPDSPQSLGLWSGDGTRLAVAADGDLWLFDAFTPVYLPPDRPLDEALKNKLSLLKSLHSDGLVTLQDYQARRARLLEQTEVLP